ncbi:facilitated trehalose transporter Tret1-like isoform X2 [Homarus americanus]|uniref:Facilitated trehalose transporter Tret1-like 21 n=1 Tax=Homarus americanus TaxID=6706 RepID=A0A8J5K1N5_HOMAM|nr:facilitated trehalose transporter Tret1-like isoform X2 [Homarus americanus]KAG7165779.1 Facilitated trehalose transporter Tret1-like 21 [Homarus americanus]
MEVEEVRHHIAPGAENTGRGVPTIVLAVVSSGLLSSGIWAVSGYSVVILPQVRNTNATFILSPSQASWFATLPLFMCIPGSLLGGMVGEWAGPKRLMLVLAPVLAFFCMSLHVASWKVIQRAGAAHAFLMGIRVIQSIIVAVLVPANTVYISEITDARNRGWLASLAEAWVTLGFLLCYLIGNYLHWYTAAWVLPLITTVPSFFCLLMAPETPPWLIRNGKIREAKFSLLQLRGSLVTAEKELKELRKCVRKGNDSWYHSLLLLKRKSNLIPLIISLLIVVLKELSGLSVMSIYIVRIFQLTGVGFNPFWSSFNVGLVRLVFNLIGSVLLHHLPRKFLLIGGALFSSVGTMAIGIFFFLQYKGCDLMQVIWLPLAGMIVYILGISAGVQPSSWVVATEILPGPVRSLGLGVSVTCYAISSFFVSKTFEDVQKILGLHGLFWSYTLGCLTNVLFVAFFVPETRGKSLEDIEKTWARSSESVQIKVPDEEIRFTQ